MSFTDTSTANFLVGDGSNLIFPFTFALQQSADMRVYVNQVLISSGLYTVTINSSGVGGNVTFNVGQAPANLAQTVLTRLVALTQATQLPREGSVPAKTLEKAYDKLTQLVQDLDARLDRTFGLSLFTTYSGSYKMPDPQASRLLRTNAAGTGLEWATSAQVGIDNNATYTRLQHIIGYKSAYDHILSNDTLSVLALTDPNSTATATVKSETGTSDDLSFFKSSLLEDGMCVVLRAFSGHTITIRHNLSPGADQLPFIAQSGTDMVMSGNSVMIVQRVGSFVYEVVNAGFTSAATQLLRLGGTTAVSSPRLIPSIPAAPTVTVVGTTGATTRAYAVTVGDILGTETAVSANGQVTNANGTLNGSNYCQISFPTVLGRIYKVYRRVASGTPSTTGLIATVVGTGGTVTVNDTNLSASTAAPTTTTLVGTYEHIGNYVTDGTQQWYGVTLLIQGSWQNNHAITILPIMQGAAALPITGGYSTVYSTTGAQRGQGLGAGHTGYSTNGTEYGQGGGGGSFITAGGIGAALQTVQPATPAGLTYSPICQLSGSAGGAGVAFTTGGAGGAGGAGGGFGLIEATGAIVVNANITGDGIAGGAGTSADDTGGGGGSGAGLYLHSATSVTINTTFSILLRGGAGGAGGAGGSWRGGGGGGAGGYFEATSPIGVVNNGTVTLTGGGAGTSTSASIPATAGSAGASAIGYNQLMRRQAA